MLGPCPLRRPTARTARYVSVITSAGTAHKNNGSKIPTPSGDSDLRALEDDIGELRWDVEGGFVEPTSARPSLDSQRSCADAQPLQLVSKPQPRARARPSLTSHHQSAVSPTDATAGRILSGDDASALDSSYELESSATEASETDALLRGLQRDTVPMGLMAKTLVVRRKIEEGGLGVVLQPQQQQAGTLSPRVGNFMLSAGERMSQRQIAQLNRAAKRALRSSRKASDADSDADSSASTSAAGRSTYGRPLLSSAISNSTSSPDEPSSASAAASALCELPAAGNLPRPTRAEVERLVRECADLAALRILYGMYGARLSVEELVLAVHQLAEVHDPTYMTVSLWTATQAMLVELLQRITPQLGDLTMQEYVMMLAAVAKLRYVPPGDWIAAVLTQSKPRLYNATPSQLSHVLKAVARISVDPYDVKSAATWEGWMRRFLTAVQRQLPAFRADELVKTLVALSELRYRPAPEWMHKFSAALHSRLEVLEAHSLSEAMLAFAALRYQPEGPFLRAYYSQLYTRLPLADDQDLATYAQAAALLDRLYRQDFMQEFLAEVVEKLPTFKAQHLANLLNAMGRLATTTSPAPPTTATTTTTAANAANPSASAGGVGAHPTAGTAAAAPEQQRLRVPPGWTSAVAAHVGSNLKPFSGSALASAAWGLSALGHKAKPKLLDDLLSASYGKLHSCGPTDLILLLTALGNFQFEPMPGREALWDTWMVEFERFAARKSYDTRGVCDLMDAMARVPRPTIASPPSGGGGGGRSQPRPLHPDFVAGVLRSTRIYQLRNTSPGRLAALAGALATLGVRPDFGFLYNYAQAARVMWTGFSTRDYATLLAAMVHIGTPGLADSRWAADFLAITLCRMAEFDGPSLTASLDALRRLPKPEFSPSSQWLAAAAQRAVDLIRSPPPPQLAGAATAAALPATPAAAMANVGATMTPLPVLAPPSAGAAGAAGGSKPTAQAGEWWVLPMRPLTPDLLVVLVEALAALGYRSDGNAPLVQIARNLLSTTATRMQLRKRLGGMPVAAAAGTEANAAAAQCEESHDAFGESEPLLHHLLEKEPQHDGAAAAAAAFERAKVAAAAVAAAASREAPRPPLDSRQVVALEAALAVLLGSAPTSATEVPGAALLGLPRSAIRSPEEIAEAKSQFDAKRALRAARRAERLAVEPSNVTSGSSDDGSVDGSSSFGDGGADVGRQGSVGRRPGVRLAAYGLEAASSRPQSAPAPAADAGQGRERAAQAGSDSGDDVADGRLDRCAARPGAAKRPWRRSRVKVVVGKDTGTATATVAT